MKPPDFLVKGYFSDGKMEARLVVLPRTAQRARDRGKISAGITFLQTVLFFKIHVAFHVLILRSQTNCWSCITDFKVRKCGRLQGYKLTTFEMFTNIS